MTVTQSHHCVITQINIDKIRKFPGNVTICTKYINGNNAGTVLTKNCIKPSLTGHCWLIVSRILGKVGGWYLITD